MANNYAYSLSIGAEFDNEKMSQELQKIKEFVNKSSNETNIEIKALIDQDGLEKQIYNTRDLLNKITGEKEGTIEIFKFGDQFIEVQKNLDGVISSVEKMSESMRRIQNDIQPMDNLNKRLENIIEKVHQLNNVEHRSFVNQEDLNALNESAQQLRILQDTLNGLNNQKDYFNQQSNIVSKYSEEISKLNTRMKDVENTSKLIAAANKQLSELNRKPKKSDEDIQSIVNITKEVKRLKEESVKSKSVVDSLNKALQNTKIPKFQGDPKNQIDGYNKIKEALFENKEIMKEVGEETRKTTDEIRTLMNGMEVGINKANNSSKEYKTTFNELSTALKDQYKEASNVQKALNTAYSSGNQSAIQRFSDQIKEVNNRIKQTKSELTRLTGNSNVQKDLSADYGKDYANAKASEKYAKEEAAIKQLDIQLKQLIATKIDLAKAENLSGTENYINYLKQLESSIQANVEAMTSANKTLDKHANQVLKDAQNTIKSAEAQAKDSAERKKNGQLLNEYKSKLQELVKQKSKEHELDQKMKNNSSQRTEENKKLIESYKQEIQLIEQKLKALQDEAKGTQTTTQMSEMYGDALRKVEQAELAVNAEGKKQVNIFTNIAQGMKEATARVVNYTLAFQALNKAWDFLRNSITIIKEMNDVMTGVQMVTGQTAEQTAVYANELSHMAEGLGATTTEIAKAATELNNGSV